MLTKEDFKKLTQLFPTIEHLDKRFEEQTKHFDKKIEEQTEALARMVKDGFDGVDHQLAGFGCKA